MDQSRYEPVPKKESKAGKAFKNFGKYIKSLFKSIIESFQYNRMKLPALLLAIGGLLIGLFLATHAATIKQLSFTYSIVDEAAGTKSTYLLPGMPYDYTGIVIFILMLLGILNIFIALNFSSKQNLGSVVTALIITVVMVGLTVAYVYAVFYFRDAVEKGVTLANGTKIDLGMKEEAGYAIFTKNYMKSIIVICVADGLSLIACIFGFVHYNRAYEKVSER